jgi:hypothetical protein
MVLIKTDGEKAKIVRNIKNIQLKILPVIRDRKNNLFMPYKFEKTLPSKSSHNKINSHP